MLDMQEIGVKVVNDIINKLKSGEKLSEYELRELCWSGYMVEEIEG